MGQNDKILELFRKYIDRELSEDELEELKEYLEESPDNKYLFTQLLSFYKTNLQIKSSDQLDMEDSWHRIHQTIHAKQRRIGYKVWLAAASILVIVGLSSIFYWNISKSPVTDKASLAQLYPNVAIDKATLTLANGQMIPLQGNTQSNHLTYKTNKKKSKTLYNKITVPEGSEYSVTLSDGTRIHLNAKSELEYPVTFSSVRSVKLQGEAYFEVTHNVHSPFIVHTGDVQVRVLGTKFNVSTYNAKKILVTLVKGKVAVTSSSGNETLHVGDQAQISEKNITKQQVNTDTYISWVDGTYEFNDTPMDEIMQHLSLWYNVKIVFSSPDLKKIKFTGAILRKKPLGYTFELIQKISNLDFKKRNDEIIVTEKGETR